MKTKKQATSNLSLHLFNSTRKPVTNGTITTCLVLEKTINRNANKTNIQSVVLPFTTIVCLSTAITRVYYQVEQNNIYVCVCDPLQQFSTKALGLVTTQPRTAAANGICCPQLQHILLLKLLIKSRWVHAKLEHFIQSFMPCFYMRHTYYCSLTSVVLCEVCKNICCKREHIQSNSKH